VENRFSAVIDLSLFRKGQMIRFMVTFAETLYRLNREAVHLFVDEADAVAPQARTTAGTRIGCSARWRTSCAAGGSAASGARSSPSAPPSQQERADPVRGVLVALRMVHPKDIDAIEEWVNVHADPATAKEMIASLPSLPVGTAWFWSPGWGDIFKRVKVRKRETFDRAPPRRRARWRRSRRSWRRSISNRWASRSRRRWRRRRPTTRRNCAAGIAELEKQLRDRPAATVEVEKIVKVPVLENGQLERTEGVVNRLEQVGAKVAAEVSELRRLIAPAAAPRPAPKPQPPPPAVRMVCRPARPIPRPPTGDVELGKCERAILSVLAQHPDGCLVGKLTLLAGYRYSGGFRNSLGALRAANLIEGGNGETIRITDAGRETGPYDALPTGRDLVDYWLNHPSLGKCERAVLRHLIEHPDGATADELCAATGYEYSGGFRNSLGALRTAGLIEGRNTDWLKASDELLQG
jgi:hypothetical protein